MPTDWTGESLPTTSWTGESLPTTTWAGETLATTTWSDDELFWLRDDADDPLTDESNEELSADNA